MFHVFLFQHRRISPTRRPEVNNHPPTQHEMNMNGTNGIDQSAQPETNHYATVPENTSTGQSEAPSGDTRGYHVARGPHDNYQTSSNVPLPNKEKKYVSNDYGYANAHGTTGPDKWDEERVSGIENGVVDVGHRVTPGVVSARINSSSPGVIYTEVQRKRTDVGMVQQVGNADPPSESDMVMVENDLYHCVTK